jgi:formylmethanofuran dehydrogenase subunit E
MKSFEEYLRLAGPDGHPRAGIILGIRMALLGLKELGIDDLEKAHDDLVVVVETDRCLPDAVELVTGCRLGNRRLKLRDMARWPQLGRISRPTALSAFRPGKMPTSEQWKCILP